MFDMHHRMLELLSRPDLDDPVAGIALVIFLMICFIGILTILFNLYYTIRDNRSR